MGASILLINFNFSLLIPFLLLYLLSQTRKMSSSQSSSSSRVNVVSSPFEMSSRPGNLDQKLSMAKRCGHDKDVRRFLLHCEVNSADDRPGFRIFCIGPTDFPGKPPFTVRASVSKCATTGGWAWIPNRSTVNIKDPSFCKEGVVAGARAAVVATVASAVPTLASVRMLSWARRNLNPTAQALIVSIVGGSAFFVVADMSTARKNSFKRPTNQA